MHHHHTRARAAAAVRPTEPNRAGLVFGFGSNMILIFLQNWAGFFLTFADERTDATVHKRTRLNEEARPVGDEQKRVRPVRGEQVQPD